MSDVERRSHPPRRDTILKEASIRTGFTFRFAPGSELEPRILDLIDRSDTQGVVPSRRDALAFLAREIPMGTQSEWIDAAVSTQITFVTGATTCVVGILFDDRGRYRLFHDELLTVPSELTDGASQVVFGVFLSGLTDVHSDLVAYYRGKKLQPFPKNRKDPRYAYANIIVDPVAREVMIGYVEDLNLKEYDGK